MTKINLHFTDRKVSLSGEVDDLTPLFFMSFLFNKSEKELYAEGKYRQAAQALIKRRDLALESLSEAEHDEEILSEFFYKYNHTEARQEIINRLLEIFDFPEEMIKIKPDGRFKTCLYSRELAEIVFGIIGALKTPKIEESEEMISEEAERKKSWKPLAEVKAMDKLAKSLSAEKVAKELANRINEASVDLSNARFSEKERGIYTNDDEIHLKPQDFSSSPSLIQSLPVVMNQDGSLELRLNDQEKDALTKALLKNDNSTFRATPNVWPEDEEIELPKPQEKSPEALELEILEAERVIEALKANKAKLETLKQNA